PAVAGGQATETPSVSIPSEHSRAPNRFCHDLTTLAISAGSPACDIHPQAVIAPAPSGAGTSPRWGGSSRPVTLRTPSAAVTISAARASGSLPGAPGSARPGHDLNGTAGTASSPKSKPSSP